MSALALAAHPLGQFVEEPRRVRAPLTDAQRDGVDAHAVDHSHLTRYPLPLWCANALRGEQRVARRRGYRDVTRVEVMQAWRCLFAGTDGEGRRLVRRVVRRGLLWREQPW